MMALYYYIFLSHLLASSATVVGVPLSGSNECWFEGIVGSLFSMSAIMWTVSVLVLLYSNVAYKKPVQLTTIHHLLCWCIPLLCVLLPLSNSTYAAPSAGIGWCRVVGPDALAWMWASHYGVVYLCYLATLVITVRFFVHINGVDVLALANDTFKVNVRTSDKFKSAMWVVLAYPLVYFICWVPSTVVDVMSVVRPDVALTAELMDFAAGLACLTGFFTSIVFWVTNEYVRDLWLGVVNRAAAASSGHDLSSYRSFMTVRTPAGPSYRLKPIASMRIVVASVAIPALLVPKWFSGSARTGITECGTGAGTSESQRGPVTTEVTFGGLSAAPSAAPSVDRPARQGADVAHGDDRAAHGIDRAFSLRSVDRDSGETDPEAGLGGVYPPDHHCVAQTDVVDGR